jgi:hypothetical protein
MSFTQSKFFKLWTSSPMAKAAYPLAVVIVVPLTYSLVVGFHTLTSNNDLHIRKNFNAMPEHDGHKIMDRDYMIKRLNNDKNGWYNPARYLKN